MIVFVHVLHPFCLTHPDVEDAVFDGDRWVCAVDGCQSIVAYGKHRRMPFKIRLARRGEVV